MWVWEPVGDNVLEWAIVILILAVFSIAYGCLMMGDDTKEDEEVWDKDHWDEAVTTLDEERRNHVESTL
jgi:hypothetical protein